MECIPRLNRFHQGYCFSQHIQSEIKVTITRNCQKRNQSNKRKSLKHITRNHKKSHVKTSFRNNLQIKILGAKNCTGSSILNWGTTTNFSGQ